MNRAHGLMAVELRHLSALAAVVEEGSFAAAAARLGYTQSALSQQIASLERIVDVQVLERRSGRSPVGTTEAGALLLRHAERIVASLRAADADLAALRAGSAGALRVGTFQTVGTGVLPTLLARFGTAHPDVEVTLSEAVSKEALLELVETGGLDVSFTVLPVAAEPLETVALMADPWVLVVPANAPLAERSQPVRLADLGDLTLVAYRYAQPFNPEEFLHTLGVSPRILLRSDETATVHGLVAAGVASALLPRLAVDRNDPRVRVLSLGRLLPPRRIGLAWHRDRYHSSAFHAFVKLARDVCAELDVATAPDARA